MVRRKNDLSKIQIGPENVGNALFWAAFRHRSQSSSYLRGERASVPKVVLRDLRVRSAFSLFVTVCGKFIDRYRLLRSEDGLVKGDENLLFLKAVLPPGFVSVPMSLCSVFGKSPGELKLSLRFFASITIRIKPFSNQNSSQVPGETNGLVEAQMGLVRQAITLQGWIVLVMNEKRVHPFGEHIPVLSTRPAVLFHGSNGACGRKPHEHRISSVFSDFFHHPVDIADTLETFFPGQQRCSAHNRRTNRFGTFSAILPRGVSPSIVSTPKQ